MDEPDNVAILKLDGCWIKDELGGVMVFPKTIYEAVPYIYMSGGIAEITYFKGVLGTSSGLLLFLAGALIWVLRSNARRTDPEVSRKNTEDNEILYELKPFILIALGFLCVAYFNQLLLYPIAGIVVLIGVYLVLMRSTHRSKHSLIRKHPQ